MAGNQEPAEQDTERKILEAAAKVFMMKGKLGASMQDIADEAGINRTLLHYYFRNKDRLFDKVFKSLVTRLMPAMVRIMTSGRPLYEGIEGFVETYTDMLIENPFLPVFIFQEISLNPGRMTGMLSEMGIEPEKVMRNFRAELEKAGMKETDPRHVFASIMGMVLFPFIARPLFQALAFGNRKEDFDRFLQERKKEIPRFFGLALAGSNI